MANKIRVQHNAINCRSGKRTQMNITSDMQGHNKDMQGHNKWSLLQVDPKTGTPLTDNNEWAVWGEEYYYLFESPEYARVYALQQFGK